jgi:hypothetical protein
MHTHTHTQCIIVSIRLRPPLAELQLTKGPDLIDCTSYGSIVWLLHSLKAVREAQIFQYGLLYFFGSSKATSECHKKFLNGFCSHELAFQAAHFVSRLMHLTMRTK